MIYKNDQLPNNIARLQRSDNNAAKVDSRTTRYTARHLLLKQLHCVIAGASGND